MGTITINVNDDVEKMFRDIACATYGKKKGYLGKAVTEAMRSWIDEIRQKEIANNELKLLDTGFSMGRISVTREEVHER